MPQVGPDRRTWWKVTAHLKDGSSTTRSVFSHSSRGAGRMPRTCPRLYGATTAAEVVSVEVLPDTNKNSTVTL